MADLSDTPAGIISRLDASLLKHGEDVTLRKSNTATGEVTVRARVRLYEPAELVGIINQGDSKVIISPTGLTSFGVPPANGYVVVNDIPRRIIAPNPIRVAGTLVRIELQVRG